MVNIIKFFNQTIKNPLTKRQKTFIITSAHKKCGYGGTGRRVRLRGVWETIRVQVPVTAPSMNNTNPVNSRFVFFFAKDWFGILMLKS